MKVGQSVKELGGLVWTLVEFVSNLEIKSSGSVESFFGTKYALDVRHRRPKSLVSVS